MALIDNDPDDIDNDDPNDEGNSWQNMFKITRTYEDNFGAFGSPDEEDDDNENEEWD